MITQAIAMRKGFFPYRDFFAQYGFGMPLLLSLGVNENIGMVFGVKLITTTLISLNIFLLLRLFIKLKIQNFYLTASLFVLAYVFMSEISMGTYVLPWSSVLACSLQLIIISLFIKIESLQLGNFTKVLCIITGIFIVLLFFTRQGIGMTQIIAFILFYLYLIKIKK
jgi:hypothetical protein